MSNRLKIVGAVAVVAILSAIGAMARTNSASVPSDLPPLPSPTASAGAENPASIPGEGEVAPSGPESGTGSAGGSIVAPLSTARSASGSQVPGPSTRRSGGRVDSNDDFQVSDEVPTGSAGDSLHGESSHGGGSGMPGEDRARGGDGRSSGGGDRGSTDGGGSGEGGDSGDDGDDEDD